MFEIAIVAALMAAGPSSTELTVYNQGFGFVKEVRAVDLKAGRQTLAIEDVAAQIDPSSVGFRSLTSKNAFEVLEQNYQYDLINPGAILDKSVGKKVRFIRTIGNSRDVLEGTLLSSPTAIVADPQGGSQRTYIGMVIRTSDGRIVLNPTGEVEVEEVPEGLISRPTLLWDLDADKAGKEQVELSYITHGMSWDANYVLTLGAGTTADLQGWVTMNNNSGAAYKNSHLKLLAGDVNVAPQFSAMGGGGGMGGFGGRRAAPMQEQSLFEYHLYTVTRPVTLRNNESKQISLLEAEAVPFARKVILDSMFGHSEEFPQEGEVGTGDLKPQVRIEFVNDEASHLGMPLPKGKFRIYQRDKEGSVQFLGEDNIDHTPKNEHLSLVVGRSFDIVASRKRTDFKRLGPNTVSETFELEVRNRKEVADTVYALERHWGSWTVTEKSEDFAKTDSNTMQFVLHLKPNEVHKITYTIRTVY